MGIEPTSEAWEASILPLYDARSHTKLANDASARKRCQVGQSAARSRRLTRSTAILCICGTRQGDHLPGRSLA